MNSGEKHRYPHTEREQRIWERIAHSEYARGEERGEESAHHPEARPGQISVAIQTAAAEERTVVVAPQEGFGGLVGDRTVEERARVLVTKIANEKERIVSRPRPVKLTNNRATRLLVSIPSGYTVARLLIPSL